MNDAFNSRESGEVGTREVRTRATSCFRMLHNRPRLLVDNSDLEYNDLYFHHYMNTFFELMTSPQMHTMNLVGILGSPELKKR